MDGARWRRWKRRAGQILIYATLEMGALMGVPMRPDDIEEMTRRMNNAVAEVARPDEDPSGDPPDDDPE